MKPTRAAASARTRAGRRGRRDPLVDIGLQLTQPRDAAALHSFLIGAAVQLCSPRRTLLVLETPAGLQIAGSKLPRGETPAALLSVVTPWLNDAREQRTAALHVGPQGAAPVEQRCCIVAPLIGAQETLGYLYCDIEGRFGRFTQAQRDTLAALAAQAAAALDNLAWVQGLERKIEQQARETQAALERQAATAEILRVISDSPNDAQPVFDVIAERAARLTQADYGWVFLVDGSMIHVASSVGVNQAAVEASLQAFPLPVNRRSITGRSIADGAVVNMPDVLADPEMADKLKELAVLAGFRAALCVPMRHGGRIIGSILVQRAKTGAFEEKEVQLLETFADQAVIAIQNARMFKETQEALARQTATSDVLRVISSSPADVQPVFEVIVSTALGLFACVRTAIQLRRGDHFTSVARAHREGWKGKPGPALVAVDPAANFPSRVIVEKRLLHLPDWSAVELPPHEQHIREATGCEASLMVPLWQTIWKMPSSVGTRSLSPVAAAPTGSSPSQDPSPCGA